MKKIYNFLTSMWLMLILTAIFAIVCAEATFIENDYGTSTAWASVYGTHWFELLQLLLAINLVGNIFKFKMYKKNNLPLLIFHVGFLVILIGAGITRYFSYEGLLHIRDGQSKAEMTSLKSFIQLEAVKNKKFYYQDKQVYISKISKNYFKVNLNINSKVATLEYLNFIPNAKKELLEDKSSSAKVKMMVVSTNSIPKMIILSKNKPVNLKDYQISLNSPNNAKNKVEIFTKNDKFYIKSTVNFTTTFMASGKTENRAKDKIYKFKTRAMYDFGFIKITPVKTLTHAKEKLVSQKIKGGKNMQSQIPSAIIAKLSYNGKSKTITLFGFGGSQAGTPTTSTIDDTKFIITWGSKLLKLPFIVKLDKFELKRYPGSMSPASYASYVTVKSKNNSFKYKIFMNHVLDFKGYRLFQSSYDTDEKGTVLSVNYDPGKIPTYIGYLMLAIGFILNFFNPKSRFRKLVRLVQKDTILKSFILLSLVFGLSQNLKADPLDEAKLYNKNHAELFGDILVQKHDGRIVSMDTFSKDLILKISKSTTFDGLTSNQIILGMITAPKLWQSIPMIKVNHSKIKKILGLPKDAKYATYNNFFDFSKKNLKSPYKLFKYIITATQKRPIKRNQFDRDIIKIDERVNISYMIYTGDILKIIPKINDPHQKWYSVKDAIQKFPQDESNRVRTLFLYYFSQVDAAKKSGDWKNANKAVKVIRIYQNKIGHAIIPSESKLQLEKFFNKIKLFDRLALVYLLGGIILLIAILTKLLKPTANTKIAFLIGQIVIILAFIAQTVGLGIRWYIGGHAPWSNAYEAMVYIAWSMGLAGIIFARYSILAPALTSLIASATLFTTFLAQMDPQITNLVPVLSSYWLNIHVSVLTASYGFLGLSMILGFFTLILFLFKDKNEQISKSIIEASRINEMTAILGLVLLTIGNFLGGVWANESWGRYWSWDPKETWAWISILVYVILTHIRLIPWFRKNYYYKFASLSLVSYASIIMTFVGVNYYLSGMHSYAAGDPMPIPKYLYLIVAIVLATIAIAYPKRELKQ